MHDISGQTSKKELAYLDQDTLSWKTSEGISASASKKFSKTLPASGMMQNGKLFEQVMLAHPIEESDCSSLLNLPTPTASEASFENLQRTGIKGNHNLSLSGAVKLLPTPLANDAKISYVARNQMSLSKALLPTPTTQEGSGTHRDHRGDLTHGIKCDCKDRRTHWI